MLATRPIASAPLVSQAGAAPAPVPVPDYSIALCGVWRRVVHLIGRRCVVRLIGRRKRAAAVSACLD